MIVFDNNNKFFPPLEKSFKRVKTGRDAKNRFYLVMELGREEEQQKTDYQKKSDHVISRGLDGILLRNFQERMVVWTHTYIKNYE